MTSSRKCLIIYSTGHTGRVQVDKLETMAAGLFISADKYLMDELKIKCENYLILHMSPDNCVILLLHGTVLLLQFPWQPNKIHPWMTWENVNEQNKKLKKKIINLYFKIIYLLNFKAAVLSYKCCQSCVGMTILKVKSIFTKVFMSLSSRPIASSALDGNWSSQSWPGSINRLPKSSLYLVIQVTDCRK